MNVLTSLLSGPGLVVLFLVFLTLLIILHEMGHYLACRLFDIPVEEFGVGFPPRVRTLFEWQGTKFSLNAIPLGGFVLPRGENDPDVPGGLSQAAPWKRIVVFAAGPLANLLVAVVLFAVIAGLYGRATVTSVLAQVAPNSPAEAVGFQVGDQIVRVNGQAMKDGEQVRDLVFANIGKPLEIGYLRDGELKTLTVTPRQPTGGQGALGVVFDWEMRKANWLTALPMGYEMTRDYISMVFDVFGRVASRQAPPEEARLAGYKTMFDMFRNIFTQEDPDIPRDVQVYIFIATISISLGVFNLFPIPALDGGRIVFALYELVLRRRVPPRFENALHMIGFVLLLILLVFVNVQDFINPVQFPTPTP